MNPFSHNYFLGYINEVTPQYVKVHFPSSSLLGKFHHEGVNYTGGNVGNFIIVEGEEYGFLARITELNLPDSERKEINEKAIQQDTTIFHPSGKAELLLSFNVFEPNKTQKTISKYPCIGAKVYACSDAQIASYVEEFGKKDFEDENVYAELGKLTSNDAICNISLNALFGRHCVVVGTTGGGKSWTVAKLMEVVTQNTNGKIILIDATGEYSGIPSKSCSVGHDAYFSFKELTNSEFCFLFREHSPNTANALCEAINTLKLIQLKKLENGTKLGKNIADINRIVADNVQYFSGCEFDINQLSIQVKNECVKQGSRGTYEEDNFKLGYCSHLISRINMFLQNPVIKNALGIDNKNSKIEVLEKIRQFLDNDSDCTDTILRIGFEKLSYDFAIREIIVDFIASYLLRRSRNESFKETPVMFFIDEAHQFLNKRISADDDSSFYLQNIDSIAKETRKYGLFLCLATQMPRDIPIGTLSQMGTFIVHRLINEQDKRSVENAASSANRNVLQFLPILGEGEALLVGVDFPMPLMLKIDAPINKPNSSTPRLKKRNDFNL
ncbi:ATP-binding protein [Parabacteroides goldsteinii]|uniref:ATP-binding protein n=1 Tax=Parabacteroides goldsteinii TaxID=328812 RepID=UPI00101D05BC|nr:helicase HerA-like domain-containing protein [Parabacteroides goldsteinii]